MPADQMAILPIYLVCDLSGSMREGGRAAALHGAIRDLRDAVWLNPVVSDHARIAVLGFASTAWVALPLCDLAAADELPQLQSAGLTSYSAAFRLLRQTVAQDVARLVGDQYRVLRPLVFFVSDGEPTDAHEEWTAELAALLVESTVRPEIVAFAIGEARASTLTRVATSRCFVASRNVAVQQAIAQIGDLVVRSVVASSTTGCPAVPGPPPGFDELDLL